MIQTRTHTVTGATGYTGRYITKLLLEQGHGVQSITGHPGRTNPFEDQVKLFPFNFDQPDRLRETLQGTDTLFNTYWIRVNHGGRTHEQCVEQTRVMFEAARDAGVRRIVHISITNPDPKSDLPYFRGKGQLEDTLRELDSVSHAILRPTVLYSLEDVLLNNIAWTLRKFPIVPLPGTGEYGIQPVFVEGPGPDGRRGVQDRRERRDGRRGTGDLHLRRNGQDGQEEDGSQVPDNAGPQVAHIPGRPGPGPHDRRHRPHPGRNQGPVTRAAGLEAGRASASANQALRVAGGERRRARGRGTRPK